MRRTKRKTRSVSKTLISLDYDIIWMAGGWGAAYDLGFSQELGDKISEAYAEDILLGSVCHGALGFPDGNESRRQPTG